MTLRIESVPLLVAGLPWSIQLSALALTVTAPAGQLGSTVHACVAGEPSTLPAASVARTLNSWLPSASAVYAFGEEQVANAAPSSEHSNVAPASEEKLKVAVVAPVVAAGAPEPIVVSGAAVSTVQL